MEDRTLRRMVERLIIENRNSLNDPTTNEPYDVKGIADDVVQLIASYTAKEVEEAKQEERIKILNKLSLMDADVLAAAIPIFKDVAEHALKDKAPGGSDE